MYSLGLLSGCYQYHIWVGTCCKSHDIWTRLWLQAEICKGKHMSTSFTEHWYWMMEIIKPKDWSGISQQTCPLLRHLIILLHIWLVRTAPNLPGCCLHFMPHHESWLPYRCTSKRGTQLKYFQSAFKMTFMVTPK